ncbi:MAG TPA: serine/threonine-protein kinase [Acidobacteriaceae bacterium]|jgi:serine/threonine protein kinase|nr:serine/threonine-protein kinase [Acidobacteriaceae bacterium]
MGYKKGSVLRTAFDTYKIQAQRGEGASGEVFEALDSDGVLRAVKILHAVKGSSAGLKPSRDEFNFCFCSTHQNIIPVLDCGLTGSKAVFYVMPLYRESLRDLITRGIPPENVLRIFGQILDGIEAAHLLGISHLDLKPENILLNEGALDLVIADFGIAHLEEAALLESPDPPGEKAASNDASPDPGPAHFPYAAPEQRTLGISVGGKADVYALGILLHEMFTGKTTIGLGHADIADVAPKFAYVDWTIGRMTNPEPSRRLSIGEVKHELIARGNEFLSLQRLNSLRNEVLVDSQVDNPLLRNPITIQSVDFKGETLYLTLSTAPPADWVAAFHGLAQSSSSSGQGPDRYVFLGKLAHLRVSRKSDPQHLLDLAKSYVQTANRLYIEHTESAHRHHIEQEREKMRAKIAAEERRHQVLAKLRI